MKTIPRQVNEAIRIGNNITVKVLEVEGSQVRIGIEAPKNIGIWRSEIYQKIKLENAK